MELKLWPDDLLPEAEDVHLHCISYEHFKPQAQAALRLIGRGVFFRWDGESYHAVHPPKDVLTDERERDALRAQVAELVTVLKKIDECRQIATACETCDDMLQAAIAAAEGGA